MTISASRTPHETKIVHPRVAYILETNDWCYVHEYRLWPGIVDFVGIHRATNSLALIECKKRITCASDVAWQVNRYHEVFGYESAMQIVFTMHPPTKTVIRHLKAKNIQLFGVDDDSPCITEYHSDATAFHELLHRHHVKKERQVSSKPLIPLAPRPASIRLLNVPTKPD